MPTDPPRAAAPLDPKKLEEWKRLAEQATYGSWTVQPDGTVRHFGTAILMAGVIAQVTDPSHPSARRDAAFIAAAREAVPALIAEVERLGTAERERDEAVRGIMEGPCGHGERKPYCAICQYGRAEVAEAEVEMLRGLLREVEWAPTMGHDPASLGEKHDRCPKCLSERRVGHAPGCRLAGALK